MVFFDFSEIHISMYGISSNVSLLGKYKNDISHQSGSKKKNNF